MGAIFNDPDVSLDDIYWYNMLASDIFEIQNDPRNTELISVDEELNTRSCYVELHREGLNGSYYEPHNLP